MAPMQRGYRSAITMLRLLAGLCVLAAPALAHPRDGRHESGRHHRLPHRQVGRAMFYGPGFEGRTMANGKPFRPDALTAASRTLPLGTRARVTNRQTHRSAIVTITDRGRLRGRHVILDLSPRAARAIGLTVHQGVAPVTVQPISMIR